MFFAIFLLLFSSLNAAVEPPDPDSLDDKPANQEILRGRELFTRTAYYLGPQGTEKKWMGNRMNCENCHIRGGTQPFALSLMTAHARYPKYDDKKKKVVSLVDRINDCVKTSLRGKPLAGDGSEMKALTLYLKWLGQGSKVGESTDGDGSLPFAIALSSGDEKRGQVVFQKQCLACHQKDGLGKKEANGREMAFPALWGKESYPPSSEMNDLAVSAPFLRASMPFGTSWELPILSEQEALDVAVFLRRQKR